MRTQAGAIIEGSYRYTLWRCWDEQRPRVLFILLNPSTADATHDDPTLRRCLGFAHRLQAGSIEVVNLYSYRASSPQRLRQVADPIGARTDDAIREAAQRETQIIAGWGGQGSWHERDQAVRHLLVGCDLWCLGWTKHGQPRHPLYVRADTCLVLLSPPLLAKTVKVTDDASAPTSPSPSFVSLPTR